MDPAELAKTEAAFAKGYADWNARQAYYQANPGIPAGWDPEPDPWRPAPAGLGYSRPPRPDVVFEADKPGLVPHVLPVPLAFDLAAPESVTGSVHGWGQVPGPGVGGPGVVYVGVGDAPAPRRSLFRRLLGRA